MNQYNSKISPLILWPCEPTVCMLLKNGGDDNGTLPKVQNEILREVCHCHLQLFIWKFASPGQQSHKKLR